MESKKPQAVPSEPAPKHIGKIDRSKSIAREQLEKDQEAEAIASKLRAEQAAKAKKDQEKKDQVKKDQARKDQAKKEEEARAEKESKAEKEAKVEKFWAAQVKAETESKPKSKPQDREIVSQWLAGDKPLNDVNENYSESESGAETVFQQNPVNFPPELMFLGKTDMLFVDVDLGWIYFYLTDSGVDPILIGERVYPKTKGCCQNCMRCCGPHMLDFQVRIMNRNYEHIYTIERIAKPSYWCGWFFCCGSCGNEVQMKYPDKSNSLLGSVSQASGCFGTKYEVKDDSGVTLFTIHPPPTGALSGCKPRVKFLIRSKYPGLGTAAKANYHGIIQKVYGGCFVEVFTDSRSYELRFPEDISAHNKALLLSSIPLLVREFRAWKLDSLP